MNHKICFSPIGVIHTPYSNPEGVPVQPPGGKSVKGKVEVFPEFEDGLKDLEGFSHIILIYHFHLSGDYALEVIPFMDEEVRGVSATRAPRRPNPIGMSLVRLVRIENIELFIHDVDMLDGTPLLDIKPYVPAFDIRDQVSTGWLSGKEELVFSTRADNRFSDQK